MAGSSRAPKFYDVPSGTPAVRCKGRRCGKLIYFIASTRTPGAQVPIDCSVEGGKEPTTYAVGSGVIHFATCADRGRFKSEPDGVAPQSKVPDLPPKPPTCILCGCTEAKRCTFPVPDSDRHEDEQLEFPRYTTCNWYQLDPPICTAPACLAKREDIPLRLKAGKALAGASL
jgi:hypothetical protein